MVGTKSSSGCPACGPTSEGMAMNSSTTISAELGLRLVVPDRTTVPLLATLPELRVRDRKD